LSVTALFSIVNVPALRIPAPSLTCAPLRTVTPASRAVMPLAAGSKSNTRSVKLPSMIALAAPAPSMSTSVVTSRSPVAAASSAAPMSVSR
jgi:hypothetical protein